MLLFVACTSSSQRGGHSCRDDWIVHNWYSRSRRQKFEATWSISDTQQLIITTYSTINWNVNNLPWHNQLIVTAYSTNLRHNQLIVKPVLSQDAIDFWYSTIFLRAEALALRRDQYSTISRLGLIFDTMVCSQTQSILGEKRSVQYSTMVRENDQFISYSRKI